MAEQATRDATTQTSFPPAQQTRVRAGAAASGDDKTALLQLLAIEAEARRDSTVKRAISSSVRLRNDYVLFSNWGANQICPL